MFRKQQSVAAPESLGARQGGGGGKLFGLFSRKSSTSRKAAAAGNGHGGDPAGKPDAAFTQPIRTTAEDGAALKHLKQGAMTGPQPMSSTGAAAAAGASLTSAPKGAPQASPRGTSAGSRSFFPKSRTVAPTKTATQPKASVAATAASSVTAAAAAADAKVKQAERKNEPLALDEIGSRLPPALSPTVAHNNHFRSQSVCTGDMNGFAGEEFGSQLPTVRGLRKGGMHGRQQSVAGRPANVTEPVGKRAGDDHNSTNHTTAFEGLWRARSGDSLGDVADGAGGESAMAKLMRSISGGRRAKEALAADAVAKLEYEKEAGGRLHKWLEATKSEDVDVRREAARKLRLYSKRKQADGHVVVVAGGLEALIGLLGSDDASTVEHAVTGLLNLSLTPSVRVRLGGSGLFPALARVLSNGTPTARANAAAALFTIAETDAQKVAAMEAGVLPLLIKLADEDPAVPMEDLGDADEVLEGDMGNANEPTGQEEVARFSSSDAHSAGIEKRASVHIPRASASLAVPTAAAAAAALQQRSAAAGPATAASESGAREEEGEHKRNSARRDALLALLKLSANEEVRGVLLQKKGMAFAVRMARDGGEDIEEEAVGLISNLVRSNAGCRAAVTEEGLEALVEVLEMGTELSKELAVAGLHAAALQGPKYVEELQRLNCRPVLLILEETGTKKAQKKATLVLKLMAAVESKKKAGGKAAAKKPPELSLRDELMSVSVVSDGAHKGVIVL